MDVTADVTHDGRGVRVTCTECGHSVVEIGKTATSLRVCLERLRKECPRGQRNTYEILDDVQEGGET